MVRADDDGPAFIQEVQELSQVVIRLDIEVFHSFFIEGAGQFIDAAVSDEIDQLMLLEARYCDNGRRQPQSFPLRSNN